MIKEEKVFTGSLEELPGIAEKIVNFAGEKYRVWCLEGDLGAGKTTFTREVCRLLNIEENVTSPTFSLVNEYEPLDGEVVYHFDLYRVKDISEAEDIGITEYLDSGSYCFIEWPQLIMPLMPEFYLLISITTENGKRIFKVQKCAFS